MVKKGGKETSTPQLHVFPLLCSRFLSSALSDNSQILSIKKKKPSPCLPCSARRNKGAWWRCGHTFCVYYRPGPPNPTHFEIDSTQELFLRYVSFCLLVCEVINVRTEEKCVRALKSGLYSCVSSFVSSVFARWCCAPELKACTCQRLC